MTWTRVDAERLARRRVAPAVPANLRDEGGWVRTYITLPTDPEEETLEPDHWLRPAT